MLKSPFRCAAAALLPALAWAGSTLAQLPAVRPGDRASLEVINAAWLKSYETRDPSVLERVLSPDFIGIYGDNALSKPQMLAGLAKRPPTRVSWEGLQIHVAGDSAVVTATSTITTTGQEGPSTARFRYADVYVRQKGDWRAVASHVVRLDTGAR